MRKESLLAIALIILSACNQNGQVEPAADNQIQSNIESNSATDSANVASEMNLVDLPPEKYESSQVDEIGWELMRTESFGNINIGMDSVSIISVLGMPDSITEIALWGADGGYHNDWIYSNHGLIIGMNRIPSHPDVKYHQTFSDALTVTFESELESNRRIHVGSTKSEVLNAYQLAIEDTIGYNNNIIAGTAYGGLIFKFENDTVTQIFLGAGAE